ncbi:DNA-binding MurR/RpiR family transcriptional regulator [Rhodoligotrophos appendicifer]|uniref:MurR/RpiR family transcriptional regulator n=1 Tax=Rhodoligotrophos appendicifer TaxID=987056 RepID=UPI00117DD00A|nr:MurR/RpiR family transcriptional regulator [Rhodoligotrophos appendicifer]
MKLTTPSTTDQLEPAAIVELLKSRFGQLSPKLRAAARFVIDHPEEIAINSMRATAKRADVHPNTMLRIARELDFDSYQSFRDCFRKNAVRGSRADWLRRAHAVREHYPQGPSGPILSEHIEREMSNIRDTFSAENIASLEKAVAIIDKCRRIYVVGLRSMFAVSYYFHYVCRFFSGKTILLTGTGGTFADELRGMEVSDVLLVFSYRPYTMDAVKAVNFARKRGAKIITVTDSRVSPVTNEDSLNFIVNNSSDSLFPTVLPAFAIAQALAHLLVSTGDSNVMETISRSQEQLDNFGVYCE